jgi:predicted nucleic acid-binding protein
MSYLVTANVFLRLVSRNDPERGTVLERLRKLSAAKEELFYTYQVLAEFWAV